MGVFANVNDCVRSARKSSPLRGELERGLIYSTQQNKILKQKKAGIKAR